MSQTVLKRLFKNASVLLTGQVLVGVMGLLSILLAARALGPQLFGIFAMIQAYILVVDRLMNFQCWQTVVKFGASIEKENKPRQLLQLVKFCTMLDIITAFAGTTVALLGVILVTKIKGLHSQTVTAAMIYSCWILFNIYGSADGVLRLYQKFKLIASVRVISAALKLAMVVIGYLCSAGLNGLVIIWVAAGAAQSVMMMIAGWGSLYKRTGTGFLKAQTSECLRDKKLWNFVLNTNFEQSVRLASRELDVLIVGSLLGAAVTGIYKIAKQFASISIRLLEPVSQAVYPEFSHLAAKSDFSGFKHLAARVSCLGGGITLSVLVVFMLFGKWILYFIAGGRFTDAWAVAAVIMSGRFLWGIACPFPSGLLAMGRADKVLTAELFSLAVFLPSLYFLALRFAVIGAAFAQVIFFIIYSLLMFTLFAGALSQQSKV